MIEPSKLDLGEIEYIFSNVKFIKGDILTFNFENEIFDYIINCSSIEHVGLQCRFGSNEAKNGNLIAMERLKNILKKNGIKILTIPCGIDAVFEPFYRVYGIKRLPLLIKDFEIINEEFWIKNSSSKWVQCEKEIALNTKGSYNYYALGLFVLKKIN